MYHNKPDIWGHLISPSTEQYKGKPDLNSPKTQLKKQSKKQH